MKKIILLSLLILSTLFLQAQGLDPVAPAGSEVPIDGGIGALLVIGALYGAKTIKNRNREKHS